MSSHRSFPIRPALAALTSVLLSCGGPRDPDAPRKDPEQQSIAEYDIARDLWIRRNDPRQALERALEAVSLDDRNADAAHLVALLYLDFCRRSADECRLEEAARHARLALRHRPDFREAKNTLGVVYIHQEKYPSAIEVLEPLTQDILYQTPENAWGNLGWALLEKGDVDAAIRALRRSVAAQPEFCVGHYRLGLAYERKGDSGSAVEAFTNAVEREDPLCQALQDGYAGRARALLRLGREEEAEPDLERCIELDQNTKTGRECGSLLAKLR